jgi:hypothetical protein
MKGHPIPVNGTPSPRRVKAGRINQRKSRGLTLAGREKLRMSALAHKPWRFSTGPTSAAGKRQAALNGKLRQKGPVSVRERRAEAQALIGFVANLQALRRAVSLGGERSIANPSGGRTAAVPQVPEGLSQLFQRGLICP